MRLVVSSVTREVVEHKYDSNNTLSLLSWDAVQREVSNYVTTSNFVLSQYQYGR